MKKRRKSKRYLGRGREVRMRPYYTISVGQGSTEWHAKDKTGPFSRLRRGAFDTAGEARAWAREHLGLRGWKVKRITEIASGPFMLRTLRRGSGSPSRTASKY